MSLHVDNATSTNYLTISATAAATMGSGAYTFGVLAKRTTSGFPNFTLWTAWEAGGSAYRGNQIYIDDLYPAEVANGGIGNVNMLRDGTTWYWLVASKGVGTEAVRYHWATYAASGALTWTHADGDLTGGVAQSDHSNITVIRLGSLPGGGSFSGDWAALAAFNTELTDGAIEAAFTQVAQDAFDATPDVLVLAPEVLAGSGLADAMGGAGETDRTAAWTTSPDPAGFDFAVSGGGGGGGDTTAPTVPTALIASNVTTSSFDLAWTASTDNTAVTGYQYTLNAGTSFTTASSGVTISGLSSSGIYTVSVRAFDAAGNSSAWSTPLPVTTLPGGAVGGSTAILKVRLGGTWITVG